MNINANISGVVLRSIKSVAAEYKAARDAWHKRREEFGDDASETIAALFLANTLEQRYLHMVPPETLLELIEDYGTSLEMNLDQNEKLLSTASALQWASDMLEFGTSHSEYIESDARYAIVETLNTSGFEESQLDLARLSLPSPGWETNDEEEIDDD